MMNILNGGAHASNNIDIQEFMVVPFGIESFAERLRAGSEIYHSLGSIFKKKGLLTGVGDEGGFAPSLDSDETALDCIMEAIEKAGYTDKQIGIALDVASSEWVEKGNYTLKKRGTVMTAEQLCDYYEKLCAKYPIMSIEDGVGEDTFIADLAVAVNAPFIKSGAPCRSDRVAKYNRLLIIESEI